MMTTGILLAAALATDGTSAGHPAARARSRSHAETKSSTTLICSSRSSSRSGPFQMMSTLSSFPALIAPAWTDFQNSCVVPLGMTAICGLPESPASSDRKRRAICSRQPGEETRSGDSCGKVRMSRLKFQMTMSSAQNRRATNKRKRELLCAGASQIRIYSIGRIYWSKDVVECDWYV